MMKKDPYFPIDSTILKNYDVDPVGVDFGSEIKRGYLCTSSYFNTWFNFLYEGDNGTLPNTKSKLFFTPGCKTTQSRLREITKQLGHTFTNDYSEADVMIVANNSYCQQSYPTIKTYHLAAKNLNELVIGNDIRIEEYIKENPDVLGVYTDQNKWSHEIKEAYRTLITPMLIGIRQRVTLESLPFISEDRFIELSNGTTRQPIDEAMIETINQMISGYDDENRKLAAQLLVNIDPKKNRHLLWRLLNSGNSKSYLDNRNKDFQGWLKEVNYYSLYDIKAEAVIRMLRKDGELDHAAFMYLEPFARKEINIYNRDMYRVTFTLKEEWVDYLKSNEDGD